MSCQKHHVDHDDLHLHYQGDVTIDTLQPNLHSLQPVKMYLDVSNIITSVISTTINTTNSLFSPEPRPRPKFPI